MGWIFLKYSLQRRRLWNFPLPHDSTSFDVAWLVFWFWGPDHDRYSFDMIRIFPTTNESGGSIVGYLLPIATLLPAVNPLNYYSLELSLPCGETQY